MRALGRCMVNAVGTRCRLQLCPRAGHCLVPLADQGMAKGCHSTPFPRPGNARAVSSPHSKPDMAPCVGGPCTDATGVVFHINGERHVIDNSGDYTLSLNDYIRRKTRFTVTTTGSP